MLHPFPVDLPGHKMSHFVWDGLFKKLLGISIKQDSVYPYPLPALSHAEHACCSTAEVEQNVAYPERLLVMFGGVLKTLPNSYNCSFYVIQLPCLQAQRGNIAPPGCSCKPKSWLNFR